jgi:hypothetical protein
MTKYTLDHLSCLIRISWNEAETGEEMEDDEGWRVKVSGGKRKMKNETDEGRLQREQQKMGMKKQTK